MAKYTDYRSDLVNRFWDYQSRSDPQVDGIFERRFANDGRPPVFLRGEAWRNVLLDPGIGLAEKSKLLSLVPMWDRHRWFGSMSSSQALAQSVFGNLAVRDLLHRLNDLQADEGQLLLGNSQISSSSFAMEHKVRHLGEPRPTSLDGYVSGSHQVAIECKLMETDIGTCSRPQLTPTDTNYANGHCNGNYEIQHERDKRCSLTQAGVLYWRHVPVLFKWRDDIDLTPCPLNANYQLVRNILAVCTDVESLVPHENGHAVLIYDARNPTFQDGGKGLAAYQATQEALYDPGMLRKCSWQRLIFHLHQRGVLPWLTEHLELKYGLCKVAGTVANEMQIERIIWRMAGSWAILEIQIRGRKYWVTPDQKFDKESLFYVQGFEDVVPPLLHNGHLMEGFTSDPVIVKAYWDFHKALGEDRFEPREFVLIEPKSDVD